MSNIKYPSLADYAANPRKFTKTHKMGMPPHVTK